MIAKIAMVAFACLMLRAAPEAAAQNVDDRSDPVIRACWEKSSDNPVSAIKCVREHWDAQDKATVEAALAECQRRTGAYNMRDQCTSKFELGHVEELLRDVTALVRRQIEGRPTDFGPNAVKTFDRSAQAWKLSVDAECEIKVHFMGGEPWAQDVCRRNARLDRVLHLCEWLSSDFHQVGMWRTCWIALPRSQR